MKTQNLRLLREQGEAMNRAEAALLRELFIIFGWLRQFDQALDDSPLVSTYRRLRGK
jgi:hypothetical protein